MDVYGFYGADCSYPYNPSDELAKQMFEQQSLASSVPFSPGNNMPMPLGNPWNSRGLAWGMQSPPALVQFTGQAPFKDDKIVHCKRKSLDVEPAIPAKQLITEEKMAAHLNGLHISTEYTAHAPAESMDVLMESRDAGAEALGERAKGHTIVLSEEVKRIREEPILPAVLIERLKKPVMSLVVWKPRDTILEQHKEKESKPQDEEPRKRNGVLVDNNNDIDMWASGPNKWSMRE
ncbi:Uncharacterized protein OBRU01_09659 [Operophtera brumata]|uniref:Uncharacterized protein n=1 Tax=Operophtera brumata TaxID=104452 RepID=A0A0L7LEY0_OPEBR|nr:Uncharacterized protein OBRU01_09659 [Operophtera brumata]